MKRKPPAERRPLALIQLNEIDLELVRRYLPRLRLPHFERLLAGPLIQTRAEAEYALLEPWIQWPSVYTGLTAAEHGLRRLGDAVGHAAPQIFETLEGLGLRVGCLSPINAENRLRHAAYFVPDPWTATPSDGGWWSRRLAQAMGRMVNDNAKARSRWQGLPVLLLVLAALRFSPPRRWLEYLRLGLGAGRRPWCKALVLDVLLADLHVAQVRRHRPDFCSVFLNAGAHIQHHYLLASPVAGARLGNPPGYLRPGDDPVGDMLQVYDALLGRMLAVPGCEWIVATGLSQQPYEARAHYWRLREHADFLRRAGVGFVRVLPRMSRDFLIECRDAAQARQAQARLAALRIQPGGQRLFGEIDNRGTSLFVTLTHGAPVEPLHQVVLDGQPTPLAPEVVLVALKNGMHQSRGHACFSPGVARWAPPDGAHVSSLHACMTRHFGVQGARAEMPVDRAAVPAIEPAAAG